MRDGRGGEGEVGIWEVRLGGEEVGRGQSVM